MAQPRPLDTTEADRHRFWSKVNRRGPIHPRTRTRCWVWTAGKDRKGYGHFHLRTGGVRAHRVAFVLAGGIIPPDQGEVDHLCRNPSCVRPLHLEGVKGSENLRRQHHVIEDYFARVVEAWEEANRTGVSPYGDPRQGSAYREFVGADF